MTLGGEQGLNAAIGKVITPSFFAEDMLDVISKGIDVYVEKREPNEKFADTVHRIGIALFKEHVYAEVKRT